MFINSYREKAIQQLFNMATFYRCMQAWKGSIKQYSENGTFRSADVINIGNNLRGIFSGTSAEGRKQGTLSGGGAAWEGLVCWYLNLCLAGTNCIVIKQNRVLVPEQVKDALTVVYGSSPTNTESDLVAITFPSDINEITGGYNIKKLNDYCQQNFPRLEICVIQCKTNWNDNAQVPMLWDIIYNSAGSIKQASVGINGYSIGDIRKFSYAFVTVPSQKNTDKFKANSTSVLRVRNLSGGNYWGMETKAGVALALHEMLNKNFSSTINSLSQGWHKYLTNELKDMDKKYSYFGLSG